MEPQEMDAKEFNHQMFGRSLARLQQLIDLNTPNYVVCREIYLLNQRAMIAFGDDYWEAMKYMTVQDRLRIIGFCVLCQKPNDVANDDTCSRCQSETEKKYFRENDENGDDN